MEWTEKKYLELKKEYTTAVAQGLEQFEFQGVELLTTCLLYTSPSPRD